MYVSIHIYVCKHTYLCMYSMYVWKHTYICTECKHTHLFIFSMCVLICLPLSMHMYIWYLYLPLSVRSSCIAEENTFPTSFSTCRTHSLPPLVPTDYLCIHTYLWYPCLPLSMHMSIWYVSLYTNFIYGGRGTLPPLAPMVYVCIHMQIYIALSLYISIYIWQERHPTHLL